MADKKNKFELKDFYKYLPGAALVILTFSLIFFFKSQSNKNIIEAGKDNISEFVANNLKPLVLKTKISREDLFNFAVYKNLPVDKQNGSMLFIGEDKNGTEFVELKKEIFKPDTKNLDKFKQYFALNNEQNAELDSIVESYEDDVYESILFNDEKAVAVNPNIQAIQHALLTDITLFANKIDPHKSDRFIRRSVVRGKSDRIRMLAHNYRKAEKPEYLVFTPDTVIRSNIELKNIASKNNRINWDDIVVVNRAEESGQPNRVEPVRIFKEKSELYPKAILPRSYNYDFEDNDSLLNAINATADQLQNLKFLVDIDSVNNSFSFQISADDVDSSVTVGFDINTENLGQIINTAVSASASSAIDWENFGLKMDSLARVIESHYSDTSWLADSTHFDFKKFQEQLKKKKAKNK